MPFWVDHYQQIARTLVVGDACRERVRTRIMRHFGISELTIAIGSPPMGRSAGILILRHVGLEVERHAHGNLAMGDRKKERPPGVQGASTLPYPILSRASTRRGVGPMLGVGCALRARRQFYGVSACRWPRDAVSRLHGRV